MGVEWGAKGGVLMERSKTNETIGCEGWQLTNLTLMSPRLICFLSYSSDLALFLFLFLSACAKLLPSPRKIMSRSLYPNGTPFSKKKRGNQTTAYYSALL